MKAIRPSSLSSEPEPAEVLAPGEHERIWGLQEPLDFPGTVFGVERGPAGTMMPELTRRYAAALGAHQEDAELPAKQARDRTSAMQDSAYGLPRIRLSRRLVNKTSLGVLGS
jgi:hypothetical protein